MALALSVLTFISACSEPPVAPPMCRHNISDPLPESQKSSCVIRIADSLVVIRQKHSNKLTVPGGIPLQNESAQCAAHRNTWELTGFNVMVNRQIETSKSGVTYFDCQLAGGFTGEITQFPVPYEARDRVKEINLRDPFVLSLHDWQEEENFIAIRGYFNETNHTQK